MAFQSVPRTALLEFQYAANNTVFVNTIHAQSPLPYDEPALNDLADAVQAWGETGLIGQMSNEVVYGGVEVRGLENENDYVVTRQALPPVVGGQVAPTLPLNVAFSVKLASGLTGKNARGRVYVGGIPETQAASTTLTNAQAVLYVQELEQLKGVLFNAGWTMVVVSRYYNKVKRPVGVTYPVTTITYVTLRLATLRRRLLNT